jgi:alpha-1,2-mannosyltransferase
MRDPVIRSPLRGPLAAPHVRVQAIVIASVSWTFAALLVGQNLGKPLGLDFVQFYTMGRLSLTGRASEIYNQAAFSAAQEEFIPASAGALYHPVYPPQMALIMSPIALLPYAIAAVVWTCISVLVYVGVIAMVWRHFRRELSDSALVGAAAAMFPPFWYVLLFGQNSVLILMIFFLAWRALEGRHSFLAGMVFGLLAIKPQFAIPLVVIVLMGREWSVLAGAAVSLALQAMGVAAVFGGAVLVDYLKQVPTVVSSANQLEPYLYKSLSLRTLTRLVGSGFGLPAWIALTLLVLAGTGRAWVSAAPLHVRIGVVALASVLVSPHLIIYDAVLLALPLLWCGAWVEAGQGPHREYFWPAVYGLFAALWLVMPATVTFGIGGGTVFMVIGILLLVWIFAAVAISTGRSVEQTVAPFSPT